MLLRNLSANMIAGLAGPVAALVFTPFYVKRLGDAGFGAVGFFAILAVVIQLFAQGINMTLERRAAAKLHVDEGRESTQVFYGTLQLVYWMVALGIFCVIIAFSGYFAAKWEGGEGLAAGDARSCIILGGTLISLNLLTGLYSSLFIGLGRQVFLSSVQIVAISLQTLISTLLVLVKPVPSSFIIGQVISAAMAAFILGRAADREVGWSKSGLRADWRSLRTETRLSLALIAVEALGVVITYADRILIAKYLPLSSLGHYNVAQTGARGLGILRGPLLQAFTPVILSWAALNDFTGIRRKFWSIQMILMAMVGVLATVLILTSTPVIHLWMNDARIAEAAGLPMSLLVAGSFLLVMSGPPYLVAVSRKYTRGILLFNVLSLILMVCVGPWCVGKFGLAGGASVWLAYCAGSLIATHAGIARLLYGGDWLAFFRDAGAAGLKFLAVIGVICVLYYYMKVPWGAYFTGASKYVVFEVAILCALGFLAAYGFLLGFRSIKGMAKYVGG